MVASAHQGRGPERSARIVSRLNVSRLMGIRAIIPQQLMSPQPKIDKKLSQNRRPLGECREDNSVVLPDKKSPAPGDSSPLSFFELNTSGTRGDSMPDGR